MKKYSLIILACASMLVGCYELDRFPTDKLSSGTFWQTQDHADQAMMGVYSVMQNNNVYGYYFGFDCLSDIGSGYGNSAYMPMSRGTYTSSTGIVSGRFKSLYDGIIRSNTVIQNIPAIEMDDELKARYIAEAKFMRALYYFNLLDFFGGVPLYDETTVVEIDFSNMLNPRSSEEDVRAFILKDLDAAIASLPEVWDSSNKGRAVKTAAIAMKGKVLLYAKKYAEAKIEFDRVVDSKQHALYDDYTGLFKPGGDESSEIIFAIQNMGGVGTDYGIPLTFHMGTRSSFGSCWNNVMVATEFVDSYEWKDGKPFNWDDVIPGFNGSSSIKDKTFRATLAKDKKKVEAYPEAKATLTKMYSERDPRMMASIILPYTEYKGWVSNAPKVCEYVVAVGANESNGFIRVNGSLQDSYLWRKFVAEHNMDGQINNRADTPINYPIIRYADILLMLAECENELGRQIVAVSLINQVRARVDMPALNNGNSWLAANTKDEVFSRIKHERAVELSAEGHRFSDLRRWELFSTLNGKKEAGFTGKVYYTRVASDRDYLWPIPSVEMDKNESLTQNPGWE